MTSIKGKVEVLEEKMKKLEHKVKKIGAEDRLKKQASEYNKIIGQEIKKIKTEHQRKNFRKQCVAIIR